MKSLRSEKGAVTDRGMEMEKEFWFHRRCRLLGHVMKLKEEKKKDRQTSHVNQLLTGAHSRPNVYVLAVSASDVYKISNPHYSKYIR